MHSTFYDPPHLSTLFMKNRQVRNYSEIHIQNYFLFQEKLITFVLFQVSGFRITCRLLEDNNGLTVRWVKIGKTQLIPIIFLMIYGVRIYLYLVTSWKKNNCIIIFFILYLLTLSLNTHAVINQKMLLKLKIGCSGRQ